MGVERICKGCHKPIATALPACERCASSAAASASWWRNIGAKDDRDGRWQAKVLVSRQTRRAARSKGGPKGQRRG